ncbi:MAG: branched-chain amino acid ABC transporter permease [Minwuiales bacterium]|nr:branched-chain amino acid ABC transporter permease [Minwuiales bacterium]
MDLIIQQTVNAVALGGTYALLALGLAVIFAILGMINFAHGELMTITGYALFFAASAGLPFALGAPLAVLAAMSAAVLMERVAFRPVRGAGGATLLLTSFAVSVVLQVMFQNLISTRPQVVPIPSVLTGAVSFGGITVGVIQILSIVVTVVMLVLLTLFLRHTTIGLAMRAAAEDFPVTRLMGVRANAVISTAFAISGLLAAVAGILWIAQRASVDPMMGFVPVLKAFIAAILGGLGSLSGAVAGGFLLGFFEIYLAAFLPENLLPFRDAIALALVIVVLLLRPDGLIARRQETAR